MSAHHPEIDRPAAKIAALERRAEWLANRIKERSPTDKSRTFDQSELAALEAGIAAIRCITSMKREALAQAYGAEMIANLNPVLALDELQTAIGLWMDADDGDDAAEKRLAEAQLRAAAVLTVYLD